MKNDRDILMACPLFAKMLPEDLEKMLPCLRAVVNTYQKGQSILQEGSPARQIGLVLSGRAQVSRVDYYGNRSIITTIEPGQLFAESFACAGVEALPIGVTAVEECRVMLMDCRQVMTACSQACSFHNQLIYNLLRIVARKNLIMHQRAEITAKRTTREKLMAYLLLQAKQQGNSRFSIPLDRQGLADYLEVDRSGLSAEMSKLKKEGILDYHKNSFYLKGNMH